MTETSTRTQVLVDDKARPVIGLGGNIFVVECAYETEQTIIFRDIYFRDIYFASCGTIGCTAFCVMRAIGAGGRAERHRNRCRIHGIPLVE